MALHETRPHASAEPVRAGLTVEGIGKAYGKRSVVNGISVSLHR